MLSHMGSESVRIEIYYTPGCPNRRTTLKRVWEVIKELDIAAGVREVRVDPPFASAPGFFESRAQWRHRLVRHNYFLAFGWWPA